MLKILLEGLESRIDTFYKMKDNLCNIVRDWFLIWVRSLSFKCRWRKRFKGLIFLMSDMPLNYYYNIWSIMHSKSKDGVKNIYTSCKNWNIIRKWV